MRNKYYFVVYFHNTSLKSVLDAIRIIADPFQKGDSHITVKGPYRRKQQKILNEDNKEINGTEIVVSGAGNFFEGSQNTVFLQCGQNEYLYNIWKKKEEKTYRTFHPHITIYDGNCREFATQLYETIRPYNIKFSFIIDKLDLYSSKSKYDLYNLRSQADYKLISSIAGCDVTEQNIERLTTVERIKIINGLCKRLEMISNSNKNIFYSDTFQKNVTGLLLTA